MSTTTIQLKRVSGIPFNSESVIKVIVEGDTLVTTGNVTVQNQTVHQINSIEDIPDVDEIDVSDGSMLVYDAGTDKYEVRKGDINQLDGIIDGGEF